MASLLRVIHLTFVDGQFRSASSPRGTWVEADSDLVAGARKVATEAKKNDGLRGVWTKRIPDTQIVVAMTTEAKAALVSQ